MMHTARLLKRILRGDDAKNCNIYFTSSAAAKRHRRGKVCPSRDCVYIPKEVLDDVGEFDSDDCLMHGDNELCDTALVINILDVLKNNLFLRNRC